MPSLLLDGTVTAHSPIAIILPPGKKGSKVAASPPIKQIVQGGILIRTIHVPASSLRGRLRHLLTCEVLRLQNEADGRLFTPPDYILTALGGVMDRKGDDEESRKVDLAGIRGLRNRNPVVSLFGSMIEGISGRLMVGDLTPETPIDPVPTGRSVRTNPFTRNPDLIQFLEPERLVEFNARQDRIREGRALEDAVEEHGSRLKDLEKKGAEADLIEAMKSQIADEKARAAELLKDGAVSLLQPLDGYSVIPQGTIMKNTIRLLDGTADEMAILMLALDLLARRPLIGGHLAHGCGEIGATWSLRVQDGAAAVDAGTASFLPYGPLVVESSHPLVQQAHQRALSFGSEAAKYDFSVPTPAPKPTKMKKEAEQQ